MVKEAQVSTIQPNESLDNAVLVFFILFAFSIVYANGVQVAEPTKGVFETVKGYIPILLTGGIGVAILGYLGVIYKSKMDLRISNNATYSKFTESVFAENERLRKELSEKTTKLSEEMISKLQYVQECKILEQRVSDRDKEISELKETNKELAKEVEDICEENENLEKKIVALEQGKAIDAIRRRMKDSGLSEAEVTRIIEGVSI